MDTGRLEAFTDGVMAVALTIMVLELRPPHQSGWAALLALWPVALSYVLSFIYIGIYWNNHHHMMRVTDRINGRVLWANLFLIFWITLIPMTTAWMSESEFASAPIIAYGFVLLMAAVAFLLLQREILLCEGRELRLGRALGRDAKGKLSFSLYIAALVAATWLPWLSCILYAAVAAIWFVPDRRFEEAASTAG